MDVPELTPLGRFREFSELRRRIAAAHDRAHAELAGNGAADEHAASSASSTPVLSFPRCLDCGGRVDAGAPQDELCTAVVIPDDAAGIAAGSLLATAHGKTKRRDEEARRDTASKRRGE